MTIQAEDKIRLLETRTQLEAEVEQYRKLIEDSQRALSLAEKALGEVNAELNASYDSGVRYSSEQIRQVRVRIKLALYHGKEMPLRDVMQALFDFPAPLVEREIRNLARDPHSAIKWNGKRGAASAYSFEEKAA